VVLRDVGLERSACWSAVNVMLLAVNVWKFISPGLLRDVDQIVR
jgi:hypothetical protein